MTTPPRDLPCRPLSVILRRYQVYSLQFASQRRDRRLPTFCALIEGYLREHGVESIDLRERAPRPRVPAIAPIERVLELLDRFDERRVNGSGRETLEFRNAALSVVYDFMCWLDAQSIEGRGLAPVSQGDGRCRR